MLDENAGMKKATVSLLPQYLCRQWNYEHLRHARFGTEPLPHECGGKLVFEGQINSGKVTGENGRPDRKACGTVQAEKPAVSNEKTAG